MPLVLGFAGLLGMVVLLTSAISGASFADVIAGRGADLYRKSRAERVAASSSTATATAPAAAPDSPTVSTDGVRAGLRPRGQWGGAAGPALWLFKRFGKPEGLTITSAKRNNTNPYSGAGSDHDFANGNAYAIDASNGSSPTPQMDRYAYRVMRALGFRDYQLGTPINATSGVKTIAGVRFQVIYRGDGPEFGGNHLSHVHIGVKVANPLGILGGQ